MSSSDSTPSGPENPIPAQVVQSMDSFNNQPIHIVLHQGSKLATIARLLPWLFVGIFMLFTMIRLVGTSTTDEPQLTEKYHSLSKSASDKIAIINVSGVIMSGEGYVKRQIEQAEKDESVKAIVLRVESPGGTIVGSHRIYRQLKNVIKEREIPLVVSMGSMAASGGYYISMAVGNQPDSIFAEPTTTTGSIGVILPHYDLSGLLTEYKIKDDSIKSHPMKDSGSMTRKMKPEERVLWQKYIDASFDRFKEVIRSGRPRFQKDPAQLDKLATGQVFTAQEAIANGLVDKEGYLEDAILQAAKAADLDVDNVQVVEYKRPRSLMDYFAVDAKSPMPSSKAIINLATPTGYYLSSGMSPIALLYAEEE